MGIENPLSFSNPESLKPESPEKELLLKIEEKQKIAKEIEDPRKRVDIYLEILKDSGKIENAQEKAKIFNEISQITLETLKTSDPSLWEEKKEIKKGLIISENKKLKIYENLTDEFLKNEEFLTVQKENKPPNFLLNEIFLNWFKELNLPDLKDLTSKEKDKQKIAQFRAQEAFNFYQKALETNTILASKIQKDWPIIKEGEVSNIDQKEKLRFLFGFTENWLDKENLFEKERDNLEIQKALKKLNIEFPKKEEIYENTVKITYLNKVEFENLKNHLEKFFPSNIQDRIKIDLVEFLNLSEKEKQAKTQELISSYNIPFKNIPFKEALEEKEEPLKEEIRGEDLIIEILKQVPEIKTILENPQILEILRNKTKEALEEVDKLLEKSVKEKEEIPEPQKEEKKEEVKKAIKEAKRGLLKPGFSLFGYSILAFLILSFLLEVKLIEKISKSLTGGKGPKIF